VRAARAGTMTRSTDTYHGRGAVRPAPAVLALALGLSAASGQPADDALPCPGASELQCRDVGSGPAGRQDRQATRARRNGGKADAAGAIAGVDSGATGDVVPRRRPAARDTPGADAAGMRPRRRPGRTPRDRPRPRADALDVPAPERQTVPARPRPPSPKEPGG
jgi:hypothetical protein